MNKTAIGICYLFALKIGGTLCLCLLFVFSLACMLAGRQGFSEGTTKTSGEDGRKQKYKTRILPFFAVPHLNCAVARIMPPLKHAKAGRQAFTNFLMDAKYQNCTEQRETQRENFSKTLNTRFLFSLIVLSPLKDYLYELAV